jgi:hypothetical protein
MRIAVIGLVEVADATTWAGELTVAPSVGDVTVTPAIAVLATNVFPSRTTKRAACFRLKRIPAPLSGFATSR